MNLIKPSHLGSRSARLDLVKQEMARVDKDIVGISELKWKGMGEFKMTNISTTVGKNC